jgi:uncharacterized repeat protein (TIGR01451 family)
MNTRCIEMIRRILGLVLIVVVLFPVFSPGDVAASTNVEPRAQHVFQDRMDGLVLSISPKAPNDWSSQQVLPSWWSFGAAIAEPKAQLQLNGPVDHFAVSVPPSAVAGQGFVTSIVAQNAANVRVYVTHTIDLATDPGEFIAPLQADLVSGTWTGQVTLNVVGVDKLVQAISGTITGAAKLTITPGALGSFTVTSPSPQVAGESFFVTVTAYDEFGNVKTNFNGPLAFSSTDPQAQLPTDTTSGWSAGQRVFELEFRTVGVQRFSVQQGLVSKESEDIIVNPGSLHHIRINSAANNGGQPYGYPVEVLTHDMDIYETFTMWAAGYDMYDNYRNDLVADWSLVDGLVGAIEPAQGVTTVFTPAADASRTGRIRAVRSADALEDTTGLFTVRAPRLTIQKSEDKDPVPAGAVLNYTINYSNSGDAAAQDVQIVETYDPNVTFYWAGPEADSGTNNVWTIGTLDPGENGTIYVQVGVANSLDPGTVLVNEVAMSGRRLQTVTDVETTTVSSAPDLSIVLNDLTDPVDAGAELVYQIQYGNQGNAPVAASVTMAYDPDVDFLSSSPPPDSGDSFWNLGTLSAGETGNINIRVRVAALMPDQVYVNSRATIAGGGESVSDSAATQVNAPDLVLTKSAAPDPVQADGLLTYTLIYENVGHADALSVRVEDTFPEFTDRFSCTPDCISVGPNLVRWNVTTLAAGAQGEATLVVAVDNNLENGTILTNVADLTALHGYNATAQVTTRVVSSPSLSLSISNGQNGVRAGDNLEYDLDYVNDGNGKAYQTTIVATAPSSQYVQNVTCEPAASCSVNGSTVTYALGTVLGGASGTVHLYATVRDPLPAGADSIVASAIINTPTPGDPPDGNSAQDEDEIITRPDLQVTAEFVDIMPWPGKRVTYTVHYSNEGRIATTGVAITAIQDLHTLFEATGSDPSWQPLGNGQYRFDVGDMDFLDGGVLDFVVTLTTSNFTPAMTSFDTVFDIQDDGGSGDDANPSDNVLQAKLGVPNLVVDGAAVEPAVWRGYPGYITITVRNNGTGPACGVHVPEVGCAGFALDPFLDPVEPPDSFPIEEFGDCYAEVDPIGPGLTQKVVISFTLDPGLQFREGYCKAGLVREIWLKVDNWDPDEVPYPKDYGLVPESNEYDNVTGVRPKLVFYLPLFLSGR